MEPSSRSILSAWGDVGLTAALAILLAQVGALALLLFAGGSGFATHLGVDLRPGVEIRVDAQGAALDALVADLDPSLGSFEVRKTEPTALRVRTKRSSEVLAAVHEAATPRGLAVGSFTLLNPFAAVLQVLIEGDPSQTLALVSLLALPLPLVLAAVGWRARRRLVVQRRTASFVLPILQGVGLGIAAVLAGLLLDLLLSTVGFEVREQVIVTAVIDSGGLALMGLVLFAVLAAPLGEEVFFRGFVLERLGRALRPSTALVASSILFALLHFNPSGTPHYLMLGLLLGWSYRRTGTLVAPAVAHALYNTAVLLIAV